LFLQFHKPEAFVAPRRLSRLRPAPDRQIRWSRRRWSFAVIGVAAVLAAFAIPAIPAAAYTGPIDFTGVTGDGSGNLTVTVESDYPLATIEVHLLSGGVDTGIDPTDFTDTTPGPFVAGSPQTYVLGNPTNDLAGLAPGVYSVTLDATDTNSPASSVTGISPDDGSEFAFLAQPVVTLSGSTFSTTSPDQQVSITGQISGCTTLACPSSWLDTPVTITDTTTSSQWTGVTGDTGGDFTVSQITGTPGDSYSASVPAQSGLSLAATSAGSTQDVAVLAPTSITATATPALYGQQTITGTLTYQSGLQQVAAPAGITITATATPSGGAPWIQMTATGSGGSFSITLPPIFGTTSWTLTTPAQDLTNDPFLGGTSTTVNATQLQFPATISAFSARVSKTGLLSVAGCLSSTASGAPADNPAIQIQYRTSTKAAWRELGTVSTMAMPGCKGAGFVAAGGEPAPRAYYRADFSGDSVYLGTSSPSVLAWLYQERYKTFTVTPHTVAAGQKITVTGTLQYLGGPGSHWTSYKGQKVLIAFSKKPTNRVWYEAKWVKTNSKGKFSVSFADTEGTQYWSADYAGSSNHYPQWAPSIKVTVHGRARTVRAATVITTAATPVTPVVRPPAWPAGELWQKFLIVPQPLVSLLGG
jgi:hypothetical protein